jgi:putative addiction module component (TIGR02574 family)
MDTSLPPQESQPCLPITDLQRQELNRRVAEDDASPEDAIPWEQVKAHILGRLGQLLS